MSESFITDKNAPLFLPSPVYARMDRPSDYSYKDRPESKREKPDQPEGVITLGKSDKNMELSLVKLNLKSLEKFYVDNSSKFYLK